MSNKPTTKTVKKLAQGRLNEARSVEEDDCFIAERRAFIDKFVLCEITCKAYIEKYKQLKKVNEKGKEIGINLNMRVIPSAFKCFDMSIDNHYLTPIFGSGTKRGHKTCKKLRDGIVHAMNINDIEEVHNRYCELMKCMDSFLEMFE